MGGEQAAKTLAQIKLSKMGKVDEKTKNELYSHIKKKPRSNTLSLMKMVI